MINEGKTITAEVLKNRITGVDVKPRMLQKIINIHNDNIKSLIGKGYSHATWVKYNTTQKHLTEFLKWKYNISDINIKELGFEFLSDFDFFCSQRKT